MSEKPSQMSIRSFFKPAAAAREAPAVVDDDAPAAKRKRVDRTEAGAASPPTGICSQRETPAKCPSLAKGEGEELKTSTLTQEQLERIAKNKALALARKRELEGKNSSAAAVASGPMTVMDAALSMPGKWKEKLQGEFDKPYFKKLFG